jgi:hypothetical protein
MCRELRCKNAVKFLLRRNGERENYGGECLLNGMNRESFVWECRRGLLKGEFSGAVKKA